MAEPLKPARSRRRTFLFGLVAASIATVVFFGGLELTLRVFGIGHSARFFRVTTDPAGHQWIRENGWVTAPYFSPELMRRPQPFRLPAVKAPNTYRVFVLGSSAAMGDPKPAFSLARMLEVMLRQAYPDIRFEVVNAGITAINSHVVRSIAADCAELQPDLYVVYEGNNEVIGPYGPGTVFTPFFSTTPMVRFVQTLRSTRTGQLMVSLSHRLGADGKAPAGWGGMEMFLRHEIDRDDPRLKRTQAAFRDNLLAIASAGRRAGATVFLCTVLTNEKDFASFRSRHRTGLSASQRSQWEAFFRAGQQAVAAGDLGAADTNLRAALAIDDHYAELPFQLGKLDLRQNRDEEARTFFQQALDLDVLRFRTDSRLNDTIRNLPPEDNVESIDLASAAEKASPHGILGGEFLYEHVHLTFQGTYFIARTLFPRIVADLQRRHLTAGAATPEPLSIAAVARRLAYTTYDQALIVDELRSRIVVPPFTAQTDNADRQRSLAQREAALGRELAQPMTRRAVAQFYDDALSASPDDWLLRRNAGLLFTKLGAYARGRALLEQALAAMPEDLDTLYALADVERKLGDTAASARDFASLRRLEPRYPGLPPAAH